MMESQDEFVEIKIHSIEADTAKVKDERKSKLSTLLDGFKYKNENMVNFYNYSGKFFNKITNKSIKSEISNEGADDGVVKINSTYAHVSCNDLSDIASTSYVPMNIVKDDTNVNGIKAKRDRWSFYTKFNDRGYYVFRKKTNGSTKRCSYENVEIANRILVSETAESSEERTEKPYNELDEHLYEDLKFNTIKSRRNSDPTELKGTLKRKNINPFTKVTRINEIFSGLRFSFIKNESKKNELSGKNEHSGQLKDDDKIINTGFKDDVTPIYDTPVFQNDTIKNNRTVHTIENDYLVPIPRDDYDDIIFEGRKTILDTILNGLFQMNFWGWKNTSDKKQTTNKTFKQQTRSDQAETSSTSHYDKPKDTVSKWNSTFIKKRQKESNRNILERPLPVPIELYYMKVDRFEAAKLLEGHIDGAFILRPSSQPFHIYTLSIMYQKRVYNVGVRTRPDGKLALGYSKTKEASYDNITQLIEYHYKEKIVIVNGGRNVGSTVLKKIHR